MNRFCLVASAALLATACATHEDEMVAAEAAAPVGMSTATYLPSAASGDLLEIQSGQLALQRSCDPAVRAFAQMIVNDHTRMSNEMAATARASNIPMPPPQLAPQHQAALERLASATGPMFESEFRNSQIAGHQEALALHQGYADAGEYGPLRALASSAVPVVQAHLDQAQNLPATAQCMPPPNAPRRGERG